MSLLALPVGSDGERYCVLGQEATGKPDILHSVGLLRLAPEFPGILVQAEGDSSFSFELFDIRLS